MDGWRARFSDFMFFVCFCIYIFTLGTQVHAEFEGFSDTIIPIYSGEGGDDYEVLNLEEHSAVEDESEDDEYLVMSEEEEEFLTDESDSEPIGEPIEDLTVGFSDEPTVGGSGTPTLGTSSQLTIGSSGSPPSTGVDYYVRFIPMAIAIFVCYKCANFFYHVVLDPFR